MIHKVVKILMVAGLMSLIGYGCNNSVMKQDKNNNGPRKVEMRETNGIYRLFVDGEEFFVKGAGLEYGNMEALAESGANSFRTWRIDNSRASGREVLDKAHKLGLMVMMGIDVGRERHGCNYNDTVWVAEQKETIRERIIELKDHPALLGWGIGNELNLHYSNKRVWDAVNDIAKMIHEIDGNHPATTMLAGIGKAEVDYIRENCPDLDFICIQFYGDIENLDQRLSASGYDGPYLITEWGATGHWEVPLTPWGAPIEQTSSEKASAIKKRYENVILADSSKCMGSFVFLWGQKQERTPTWYGLFTEKGEQMEPIDVMHYFWTGKWPANRAPKIISAVMNGQDRYSGITVKPGEVVDALVKYNDPDGDELVIDCEILKEAVHLSEGGDFEARPDFVETEFRINDKGQIQFSAPSERGAYRLFIYVRDMHNNAGTVNIPFKVE